MLAARWRCAAAAAVSPTSRALLRAPRCSSLRDIIQAQARCRRTESSREISTSSTSTSTWTSSHWTHGSRRRRRDINHILLFTPRRHLHTPRRPNDDPAPSLPPHILQSRFPWGKTLLAILALPVALWAFGVFEIDVAPHWEERVHVAFPENQGSAPVWMFDSPAQVAQYVQAQLAEAEMVRQPRFQEVADLAFPFLAGGWSVGSRGLREDTLALERAVEGGERVVVEVGGKKGGKVGEGSWWEKGRGEREESGLPETHGCRWRSNDPCEDYFAFGTSPGVGGKPWNYWGVYDGHAGSQTSFWLQKTLIPHVSLSLCYLDELSGPDAITKNISQTFLNADDYLMSQAKKAVSWSPPASPIGCRDVENAMAGSCALLSMFDPQTSKLRVACVGDSRAVLGRWDPVEQKYVCMPLSTDQTGFNKDEVSRIQAEHPEEDDILDPDSGRLLGLAVTRAFGDHRWKWPNDLVTKAQTNHFGTAPRPKSRTPPYLTAEPVITETDIIRHPASSQSSASPAHTPRSDFMILASDGLWDRISSADAVALVSSWLTARSQGAGFVRDNPSAPSPPQYPIPDVLESGVTVTDGEVQWRAEPAYFSVEDENAAVCLARNALGGTRKNLFHGLVQRDAPWVRNAVDDTTVIVVFFDEDSEIPAKGKGKERVEVEGIRPGLLEQFEKKEKRWWWPF